MKWSPALTGTRWFAKITTANVATISATHSARLPTIRDDRLCFIGFLVPPVRGYQLRQYISVKQFTQALVEKDEPDEFV